MSILFQVTIELSVWIRSARPGDRVSIPGRGERIFSLASVSRPALGVRPASCTMGTGGPFRVLKCDRGAGHSPPSSAEVENE
jgi:hypothetical protein